MSTPAHIPATDRKVVATITAALLAAADADGTDELAVLCNALLHHVTEYNAAVRGTRPPERSLSWTMSFETRDDLAPLPDVLGATQALESAQRVLSQDRALAQSTDPGVQNACDAIAWRLRDAHNLLTKGRR